MKIWKSIDYMGRESADTILKELTGILTCIVSYDLIAVETVRIHPFVTKELLAPLIAIVKARDFECALQIAIEAEQGCHHTGRYDILVILNV